MIMNKRAIFDLCLVSSVLFVATNEVSNVDAEVQESGSVISKSNNESNTRYSGRRLALYLNRKKQIEESRLAYEEGRSTFMLRENEFTDLDANEIKHLIGTIGQPIESKLDHLINLVSESSEVDDSEENEFDSSENLPEQVDWRSSGCISWPRSQFECGACYAIATIGVLEAMHCIRGSTVPLERLSSQQIVDCSHDWQTKAGFKNDGCDGGWPTPTLQYLQSAGRVAKEKCYRYTDGQKKCRMEEMSASDDCTIDASTIKGSRMEYKVLKGEKAIKYHVANTGPVVTVIEALDKFIYYGRGIFDDPACSGKRDSVNHAIIIVGYGSEDGIDYWLIKNSWGTTVWGLSGYGKFRRGQRTCSIGHYGWVVLS